MKIAVTTGGRFHALDIARELQERGHQVTFASDLPGRFVRRYGIDPMRSQSFFPFTTSLVMVRRRIRNYALQRRLDEGCTRFRDWLMSRRIPDCDVIISMAGLFTRSGRRAQQERGALWVVERGSRHALSQKAILEAIPGWPVGRPGMTDFYVRRNLQEYEQADVISVPSGHAMDSFLERGIGSEKMFVNPYGVDLDMFPSTEREPGHPPTVMFAGTWCWRKGCDLLTTAMEVMQPGVRLLHVGAVADGPPLPAAAWFEHVDAVPQWRLKEYYAKADVFALASREDGFGMVLSQALACGLPVVCTDRTGGEDLRALLGAGGSDGVTVVPAGDAAALANALRTALEHAAGGRATGPRDRLGAARTRLSWAAYGERYSDYLKKRMRGNVS